jgi:hypothetical protein
MTLRLSFSKAVVALGVAAVSFAAVPAAQAYPPGQDLTATSDKVQVRHFGNVTFRATKAKPSTNVTFHFSGKSQTRTADGTGFANATFKAGSVGIFTVRVTNQAEVATTKVWVPRLYVHTRERAAGVWNHLHVKYAKPGAVVKVVVGGKNYFGTVAATGVAEVKFRMQATKGYFNAKIYSGPTYLGFLQLRSV